MSLPTAEIANPKEIMQALMRFEGREMRKSSGRQGSSETEKCYLKYRCSRPGCRSGIVSFIENSGYKNPYSHLKSYYCKDSSPLQQEQQLQQPYAEARTQAQVLGGTILSHFHVQALSTHDKAVYGWLKLVVLKNIPLSHIEDTEVRAWFCSNIHVSCYTVVKVIFQLVKIVEKRITSHMQQTKGMILFDGWSTTGMHYVGVFSSFVQQISTGENVHRLYLLAFAPMCQKSYEINSTEEVTAFHAEAHLSFFHDTFSFYNIDFDDWCICLLADNASVNKRIAKLSGNSLVGCISHKLRLDINDMLRKDGSLLKTISDLQDVMKNARGLKTAAVLRNLTSSAPILPNDTR